MSATTSVRTSVFGVRPPIVRQPPTSRKLAGSLAPLAVIVLCVSMLLASSPAYAAQEPVGLGTAESFAILAGSGITNTGPTTITGDIGTFPTPTESGFGSITLIGTNHAGDAVTAGAKDDLVTAYNDAAGRTPATDQAVELGGKTLKAGVYKSGTFGLTGTLTLDAEGNTDATFIFQAATTLIAETNSRMVLLNGVDPCRVVWQVGSSATFKVGTRFVGDVLALTSITAQTGATFEGRLLARNGAVTLDTNTITNGNCFTPASSSPAPAPTSTGAPPETVVTPTPTVAGPGPIVPLAGPGTPNGIPGGAVGPPGGPQAGAPGTPSGPPFLALTGLTILGLLAAGVAFLYLGGFARVAGRRGPKPQIV
jgi:hypothetical protein